MKVSEDALRSGYVYLALFRLESNWEAVMAFQYCNSKAEVEKKGLAAFEKEWHSAGKQVAQKEKLLASGSSRRLPAAVKALLESTWNQARPYYDSSKAYGVKFNYKFRPLLRGQFACRPRFRSLLPATSIRSDAPRSKAQVA